MPLWSVLLLVAVDWQVVATSPSEAAVAPPTVSCEQATNSTAVPPPKSEADMVSMMNQWMARREAMFQMETWWQERSKQPDALASEPMPPATKEAVSQMEKWWQQRPELQPAIAAKPHRVHRRQRHYAASATEFGCPPSVCPEASAAGPNATPIQPQDQQAEQQYRQAEELYSASWSCDEHNKGANRK